MSARRTFWVVLVSMTVITIIVAALAWYIYRTTDRFSKKGDELYDKSTTFLRKGNTAIARVDKALDKIEPAIADFAGELPAIRDAVINFIREKPLQSLARKLF